MTEKDIISVNSEFELSPSKLDRFPDLHICIRYLMLKDTKMSMESIADALHDEYPTMPTTRVGLYNRIASWRNDGTLKEAELYYIEPKLEEIRAAAQYAILKYTEGLRLMADDVTNPKISLKTRTEAMGFLRDTVVVPELSQQEQPGTVERRYADKQQNFSPTDI